MDNLLEEIGLNKYDKQAYRTLLDIGTGTAKQISKESNVPYGRIYDTLHSLECLGLVSILRTEPKTFRIIEPNIAFKILIEKKEERLAKLKKLVKGIKVAKGMEFGQSKNTTILLHGKDKMEDMKDIMKDLSKRELLITPLTFNPRTKTRILRERYLRRSVKEKIILPKVTKKNLMNVREAAKLGSEIKTFPFKGFRMILKDREEALVSIVDPKTDEYLSIYTKNKEFTKSLATFFDSLWEKAKSIDV